MSTQTETQETVPTKFGPTFGEANYPAEMRRQLWPLCCGASILSGFKDVAKLTEEELVKKIEQTIAAIPDFQVYPFEHMRPKLTFLTLNKDQMNSPKIMAAIEKAGFKKFAEATPRSYPQGFFVQDTSNTWKTVE